MSESGVLEDENVFPPNPKKKGKREFNPSAFYKLCPLIVHEGEEVSLKEWVDKFILTGHSAEWIHSTVAKMGNEFASQLMHIRPGTNIETKKILPAIGSTELEE